MVEKPAGSSLARQAKKKERGDKTGNDKKNKGVREDEKGPGWGNEFEEI